MRKTTLTVLACAAIISPVHAQDLPETEFTVEEKTINNPDAAPPVSVQLEQHRRDVLDEYIEDQGWCDLPAPDVKPGQFAIIYRRNAEGRCVPFALQPRQNH